MSAKIKYTDEPLGEVKIISDFLPSPDELAFREESVKVTISLSKKSVEFFKSQATKHHTQYQRMIRQLLDAYVAAQARSGAVRSTGTALKRSHGRVAASSAATARTRPDSLVSASSTIGGTRTVRKRKAG
jgi:hypothetical protein